MHMLFDNHVAVVIAETFNILNNGSRAVHNAAQSNIINSNQTTQSETKTRILMGT